jgi:hypothetical protein
MWVSPGRGLTTLSVAVVLAACNRCPPDTGPGPTAYAHPPTLSRAELADAPEATLIQGVTVRGTGHANYDTMPSDDPCPGDAFVANEVSAFTVDSTQTLSARVTEIYVEQGDSLAMWTNTPEWYTLRSTSWRKAVFMWGPPWLDRSDSLDVVLRLDAPDGKHLLRLPRMAVGWTS